jgi:hypothetical protein
MKYFLLFLIIFSVKIFASSDESHPIIDSNYVSKFKYDVEKMSLKDLRKTKLLLLNHLDRNNYNEIYTENDMDKKLLEALFKYDDVRIQIIEVIDEIIKEYKVNSEIEKILLSYKDTFKMIIRDNRHLVKNLRDYKAYDFRLGSAYLAMMTAFHENEETEKFYSILVKDKKDVNTSIGRYNYNLKKNQTSVDKIRKEIDKNLEIQDIKLKLKKVEKEILSRK